MIINAIAIIAKRPLLSSFVCISFNSAGSVGFKPSGSKPRSPDSKSARMAHVCPTTSSFTRLNRFEAKHRVDLRNRDGDHHNRPESLERRLLEREVSRSVNVAAKERVEVLPNQEAQRRQHADAAVLQLH